MAAAKGSVDATERRLRPPSLFLMLAEARGVLELNSSLLLSPLLMQAPKGERPTGVGGAGVPPSPPMPAPA